MRAHREIKGIDGAQVDGTLRYDKKGARRKSVLGWVGLPLGRTINKKIKKYIIIKQFRNILIRTLLLMLILDRHYMQ